MTEARRIWRASNFVLMMATCLPNSKNAIPKSNAPAGSGSAVTFAFPLKSRRVGGTRFRRHISQLRTFLLRAASQIRYGHAV